MDSKALAAVAVDVSRYEASHGKAPKGNGNWMFSFSSWRGENQMEMRGHNGSYATAVKLMKAIAWTKGMNTIHLEA